MQHGTNIVVVGGVAAGMSAASQARRRLPEARVAVFERGEYISYGACGMPYNIRERERCIEDLVVLTPDEAVKDRGIELNLGSEVVEIDLDGKALVVRDGSTGDERQEPFDALILATGARAVCPGLPGMDLPGVSVLRDLGDGARIKQLVARDPRRAVIIGAGYIGMEMAHVFSDLGIEVTLLEKLPRILPGWHEDTLAPVTQSLDEHGVKIHAATTVRELVAGSDGRVEAVVSDKQHFPADIVLVAVGIRANVELASAAGLRLGDSGAIWVNQHQQTSHPAVWAAGDCAEVYHRILRRNTWIPLGTTANKQGRIAGANAAGANLRFRGIVATAGFVVFDQQVVRSGLGIEQARSEGFEPVSVTIRQRSRGHAFSGGSPVQVTLIADRPTGLLLGGEIVGREGAAGRSNVLATALASHLSVADLQGLDLVYAPPFAPVWDPLLVAANQLIKKVGRTQ